MPPINNTRIYIKLTPRTTKLQPYKTPQYYTALVSESFINRHPPRETWLDISHQKSVKQYSYEIPINLTMVQFRNLMQRTPIRIIPASEYPQ